MALEDEATMNSARSTVESKRPSDEFVNKWKEQHNATMRNKNKEKQLEMMEKRWGEYFLPPPNNIRTPRQVQCSHMIPTQQRHQQTKNRKSPATSPTYISEITTIQRPPITRYGADMHKDILDNIPVLEGKQGELTQLLNTIESYSTMYRVCKTDLILLQSRGKAHKIISHAIAEDPDVEWLDIKRKLTSNYGSTRSGIKASVKISKLSMSSG